MAYDSEHLIRVRGGECGLHDLRPQDACELYKQLKDRLVKKSEKDDNDLLHWGHKCKSDFGQFVLSYKDAWRALKDIPDQLQEIGFPCEDVSS